MTTVTLLTKIYNASQVKQMDKDLKRSFEGLDVEAEILGMVANRWVQVAISGQDEAIAANYVAEKIGFCPVSLESVKEFSTLTGYVTNLEKSTEELSIDVGVFEPKIVHATVSLRDLQAQLADGRKIALRKLSELFGFCENLPMSVKVVQVNVEESRMEAELSTSQVERYKVWQDSLLDRLLVVGSSLYGVKMALENARLERDVISVESLGMFEHALVCKLGTDAAGLIRQLGRNLRNAKFTVFNPKSLRKFLEA